MLARPEEGHDREQVLIAHRVAPPVGFDADVLRALG
jgi:hypothetical protein